MPAEPVAAVSGLDQFLPVPKSDKDLAGELRSLGYLIQQHVEDKLSSLAPRVELVVAEPGTGGSRARRRRKLASQARTAGGHGSGSKHEACGFAARHREGYLWEPGGQVCFKMSQLPPSVCGRCRHARNTWVTPRVLSEALALLRCRYR